MIWHIFKKDWKLLWPLVMIVAAIEFADTAVWLLLGHFFEPPALIQVTRLLPWAVVLGIAALIITVVHQDALPGDRQDWLVRPLRRRDLILEKLLFVFVAVQGPLLLADLAHGVAFGFTPWASLLTAFSHGVFLLLIVSLPVLAIAAMTSTIAEAIGGVLAISLILTVFLVVTDERSFPLSGNGNLNWMMFAFWSALEIAAAAIIVPLQYFRRETVRARVIALGITLLIPIPAFVPWAPAFAFQQLLSADPVAARAIRIAFDPNFGRIAIAPGGQNRANSVWLPLDVSELSPESIVISDQTNIRIIGRNGSIIFSGQTTGDRQVTGDPGGGPLHIDDFPVRTTAGGDVRTHQLITLPGNIYALVRSQLVRIELDYSLTLYHIEASYAIAALDGDKRSKEFGWCKTKLDYNGNFVNLGCIKPGNGDPPFCATWVLENTVSGQRNPTGRRCIPYYTPYTTYDRLDVMVPFGFRLPVRDPQGLAKYPVDNSQLSNAQVSLKNYMPVAHFTRHLAIPEIRLGDWEAETGNAVSGMAPLQ